jgi:hypothetical protein
MNPREEFTLRAKGYTPHDGGLCPDGVTPTALPGVAFEDGTFLRQGERQAEDIDWSRVRGWKLRDYRTEAPGNAFRGGKLVEMSKRMRAK